MSKFTVKSAVINCTLEIAFDYLSNIDNRPQWQDILVSVDRNTEAPDGNGAQWKDNFKMMGMKVSAHMKYIAFNRPRVFKESIEMSTSKGKIDIRIDEIKGGCAVTITSDLTWKGIFKLFSPLMEKGLKKGIQQDLVNVKRILESKQSN